MYLFKENSSNSCALSIGRFIQYELKLMSWWKEENRGCKREGGIMIGDLLVTIYIEETVLLVQIDRRILSESSCELH